MKYILNILYFIYYLKLPWFIIKRLVQKENIDVLKVIAKKGHYKNRIQLLKNIEHLSLKNQYKLLVVLLDDNIENISNGIITLYEKNYLPKKLKSALLDKKNYWKEKKIFDLKEKAKIAALFKNNINYKRKFGNGDSLQNVKEMLKKPMNVGKWF